jgi:hypothetical protein
LSRRSERDAGLSPRDAHSNNAVFGRSSVMKSRPDQPSISSGGDFHHELQGGGRPTWLPIDACFTQQIQVARY